MNLIEFLRSAKMEELDLPTEIEQKLQNQNQIDFQKLYSAIQAYRTFGKCTLKNFEDEQLKILDQKFTSLLIQKGLIKGKPSGKPANKPFGNPAADSPKPARSIGHSQSVQNPAKNSRQKPVAAPKETARKLTETGTKPDRYAAPQEPRGDELSNPLGEWENRFRAQIWKVSLIGEIPITKEDLDEISNHLCRLFYRANEESVLRLIARNYPATFLVFMVGQGIFGYDDHNFWPAYEKALRRSIDGSAFGRLFEKLLNQFGKPLFRDLQERSLRYVSLILAHGGVPVYCLKDFFSNVVLNTATRSELVGLEGEELVEEILKHSVYTHNTDKPVVYFLEYGGRTAANFLDRSRKMLIGWQQSQTIPIAEEIGLPHHIVKFFEDWVMQNPNLRFERSSRSRLKRPQLALDPWGLGIFLKLPAQPISALGHREIFWVVNTGKTNCEIPAHTQRRGEQVMTRETTIRLKEIPENIEIHFHHGESDYEWTIQGYSPDHLILAFDPISGHIQNHIFSRETWLLYPGHLTLSIVSGQGNLLEVLPELPGDWSDFKLECWDLSQTIRLGLAENGLLVREIYVRSQEKLEPPSFVGGCIVPTDLDENPIPVYEGKPPSILIPLGRCDDVLAELSRWQISVESIGYAEPELSFKAGFSELSRDIVEVSGTNVLVDLSSKELIKHRPIGTYQVSIKGPLGKDTVLNMNVVPECKIHGLKDLYVPDRILGPENTAFQVHTSLLDSLHVLGGTQNIQVKSEKPGVHTVDVSPGTSSFSLLIRRQTIERQFISMPVNLRINRLRWRFIRGQGEMESWLYKHSALSIQELLQEDSPLLIIDFPGNENLEKSLKLNLLDITGKVIQQVKPVDRSSKRQHRFWRFDLDKIKNSVEMIDSPIFRLDLEAISRHDNSIIFSLPVLVLTRRIQVQNLSAETYSSLDLHHVLVTWQEKRHLRSRALVLWSLFRPWQAPIIEYIPDSICNEYEFVIPNKDHAEGIYHMRMVVIDPWITSDISSYPPADGMEEGCIVELSNPKSRLMVLEREISAATSRNSTQFSNRIEAALIRQYLGDLEHSIYDLDICCRNLTQATMKEILTLRSILRDINSRNLCEEFSKQIIDPIVVNRFHDGIVSQSISLQDFLSVFELFPNYKKWPVNTCEILIQIDDPKISLSALAQLISIDIEKAVSWVIKLIQQSVLSMEDAVEILYEQKPLAKEQLLKLEEPIAIMLVDLLNRFNPYSGLPIVKIGSWVQSNVGWGKIDEIIDPRTRTSVDSFIEGEGRFILSVTMHIHEDKDMVGEKAIIDMTVGEISFPRAARVFCCQNCNSFASSRKEIYRSHLNYAHGNVTTNPAIINNPVQITEIYFNMKPLEGKLEYLL